MSLKRIRLNDISNGISPTENEYAPGTFKMSMGIDPDAAANNALNSPRASGIIKPVGYTKFSSTGLSGYPKWLLSTNKNERIYAYASDGELISYSSALTAASEVVEGTPTSGVGNGAIFYQDYVWLATPTELSRFGTISGGSPTIANTWWNGTAGLTLLTNTVYPAFRGLTLPNHAMHLHGDNAVYFCDVNSSGQGIINKLKVDSSGNDSGSVYNALDLPFGFLPTDIESFGGDLAVSAVQMAASVTNPIIKQGNSYVFFWDTVNDSYYNAVTIPDPFTTALKNVNGRLYAFSGNAEAGCRVLEYAGGDTFNQVAFFEEMNSPFPGAVDAYAERLAFGGYVTYPTTEAVVFALGSKNKRSAGIGLQCPIRCTSSGTTPIVTAVAQLQHLDGKTPRFIVGWGSASAFGIEKYSSGASLFSRFLTPKWEFPGRFSVVELRITLEKAITSAVYITPIAYIDDGDTTQVSLDVINNTNFPGKKVIVCKRPGTKIAGNRNFFIDFEFTGTSNVGITEIEALVEVTDAIKTA